MADHDTNAPLAEDLAHELIAGHGQWLKEQRRPPADSASNHASALGHPCLRHLVLKRTAGHKAKPIPLTLQGIFEEGKLHEYHVKNVLAWLGLDPHDSEHAFPKNNYEISGRMDVRIWRKQPKAVRDEHGKPAMAVPLPRHAVGIEIKSFNGPMWERVRGMVLGPGEISSWHGRVELQDFGADFVRRWYDQAQLYMFLADVPNWLILLKSKATGMWKAVPMAMDYDRLEYLTERAEIINAHVEAGTLPLAHDDRKVCRRCPFLDGACDKRLDAGPGAFINDDEYLEQLAITVRDTEIPAKEHKEAKESLREAALALCAGQDRTLLFGSVTVRVKQTTRGARMEVEGVEAPDPTIDPDTIPGAELGPSEEEAKR